ncbi:MAG TPA: hypothetical protein VHZ74_10410 [Bryobacteraceae bacterium]|jgi:hypothetical protein|nr:hypothetical protein [Bryobacteraceae bacterium]
MPSRLEEVPVSHRSLVLSVVAIATVSVSATPAAKKWTSPRTPDGKPDLQGVWTNPTVTPFERPAALANKAVLTKEEAAKVEKEAAATNVDAPPKAGDVGTYNRVWFDSGTKVVSTRQSSLVVDPPDGRVPLKPSAEAKRDYDAAHNADSWEYMSVWDRCITRGVPAGMFPAGYNNAYQIVQSPGYVTILYEMIHETRIIPVDGSPHLPSSVRQWNGDSRGHWESNTLVVDTTNYNGKGQAATSAATGRVKGIPQSEKLHVVERFTRTDADTISYEVTIDDPEVYTKPWKVAIPLVRDADYRIYEYACHEGNEAVANVLRNGRALDAK